MERAASGKVDFGSYVEANRLFQRAKLARFYCLMWVAFAAGLAWLAMAPSMYSFAAAGGIAGCILGTWLPEKLLIKRKLRRLFDQSVTLQQVQQYTWDQDALQFSDPNGRYRMTWPDFVRVIEGETVILLFHNDLMFQLISKNWFGQSLLLDDFRTVARETGVRWVDPDASLLHRLRYGSW